MTQARAVRCLALAALAAAIHIATTAAAAAYTYTFRLPMTLNTVQMETVSFLCRDVSWSGEINSGQTLTLSSAPGCFVHHIYITGKLQGKPVNFTLPIGFASAAGADIFDRDGFLCINQDCSTDIRKLLAE